MKVLVVDDNAIVRLGLRHVLAQVEAVEEIGEADSAGGALEAALRSRPDVVFLDVHMPGRSGIDVLPELAATSTVVILTSDGDEATVAAAVAAGARGYLVHGSLGVEQVAAALMTCAQGGMVLGPEAAAVLAHVPVSPCPQVHPFTFVLTQREAEVLEAAARGLSNEDIAKEHFLSPRTVKNYLNSAYPKLQVHNRAEAVIAWREAAS